MNNLFDKLTKHADFRAPILAILGILTFIFPELLQNGMVYIIAGYIILCGASGIVEAARNKAQPKAGAEYAGMVLSGLMVAFGVLTIGYYRYLVGFLPLFLGTLLAAEGIAYFVVALCGKAKLKPLLILMALLIGAGGVVAAIYSFGFGGIVGFSRIIGAMLLVSCAYELILFLTGRTIHEGGAAL